MTYLLRRRNSLPVLLAVFAGWVIPSAEARTWEDVVDVSIYAQSTIDLPRIQYSIEDDPFSSIPGARTESPSPNPTTAPALGQGSYPGEEAFFYQPDDIPNQNCSDGASVFVVNKYDAWGDGWEGITITIKQVGPDGAPLESNYTESPSVEGNYSSENETSLNQKTQGPVSKKPTPTSAPTSDPSSGPTSAPTLAPTPTATPLLPNTDGPKNQTESPGSQTGPPTDDWWYYNTVWPSSWGTGTWGPTAAPWYQTEAANGDDAWKVPSARSYYGGRNRELDVVMVGSLESGYVCLKTNPCYEVTLEGEKWQEESKWEILQPQENGAKATLIAKGKGLSRCTFSVRAAQGGESSCPMTCQPYMDRLSQQNNEVTAVPKQASIFSSSSSSSNSAPTITRLPTTSSPQTTAPAASISAAKSATPSFSPTISSTG